MAYTRLTPDQIGAFVAQSRAGDAAAFTALYRHYLPLVHSILLGRFGVDRADELSQECFLLAYQRLHQLQDAEKFTAWIATIARRMRADQQDHSDLTEQVTSPMPSPEDVAESKLLMSAIRRLPEHFREPLLLRFVEGMTGEEIAEMTGMTSQSVRVNLSRGMEKLRAELGTSKRPASIDPAIASAINPAIGSKP